MASVRDMWFLINVNVCRWLCGKESNTDAKQRSGERILPQDKANNFNYQWHFFSWNQNTSSNYIPEVNIFQKTRNSFFLETADI